MRWPPGNNSKGFVPKRGFLSGRLWAKFVRIAPGLRSILKNLSGSPDLRFFPPKIVRIGDLGTKIDLGSNSVESLGQLIKYVYLVNEKCYIWSKSLRLIISPTVTLFREFQSCCEFLLTVFEVFVTIKVLGQE